MSHCILFTLHLLTAPADADSDGVYVVDHGTVVIVHGTHAFIQPTFGGARRADPPSRIEESWSASLDTLPPIDHAVIFVGHAHYDHAGPVIWLSRWLAEERGATVEVLGNGQLQLALAPAGVLATNVEDLADDPNQPGVQGDALHLGPYTIHLVQNGHAAQIGFREGKGLYLVKPEEVYRTPPDEPPSGIWAWRGGPGLAALVEVETARGLLRFYVNDAAAHAPLGIPDGSLLGEGVHLAAVTAANFHLGSGYPEALVARLQPRVVVGMHMTDFLGHKVRRKHTLLTIGALGRQGGRRGWEVFTEEVLGAHPGVQVVQGIDQKYLPLTDLLPAPLAAHTGEDGT